MGIRTVVLNVQVQGLIYGLYAVASESGSLQVDYSSGIEVAFWSLFMSQLGDLNDPMNGPLVVKWME
jgi:hypothetical protein